MTERRHLVPVPDTVIIARKACHVVLRMCHKSATNVLQLSGYPQSLCILREQLHGDGDVTRPQHHVRHQAEDVVDAPAAVTR